MSNLALCLYCPITQALMDNLIAMLIYRSFIIQRIVTRLFALIIKLKVNRKYCCKIHQIYKIANQYNWSFFFFTMQSSYMGRFPQICTVCYSVTFKNPNIDPWSWRKIVDNTFSVCTNNIKKHIGSPPRSFISFLQFILVKGMSHCNIC